MTTASKGIIALIGNVGPNSPEHSTENDYRLAWENNGYTVLPFYEDSEDDWYELTQTLIKSDRVRLVQWTSTPRFRQHIHYDVIAGVRAACHIRGIPLVAVHLDRFWGIRDRERWIRQGDPYFHLPHILLTADGGSDEQWKAAGLRHEWLLPGVSERWCKPGKFREEYASRIAFVGSYKSYHAESRHRAAMINHLLREYRYEGLRLFPERNVAVRGQDLTDLYWSADVVVGDSFWNSYSRNNQPPPRYGSDRTPETLGRGGILRHVGIEGWNYLGDPFDAPGGAMVWRAWDWSSLAREISRALELTPAERKRERLANIKWVKAHHTYEVRVREILEILERNGM